MKAKTFSVVLGVCGLFAGWMLVRGQAPGAASAPATRGGLSATQSATQFRPDKLGQSWRDQADEAIAKKDFTGARDLYMKWLEADPRDSVAWYNLACVYSRLEEKDKAFEALDNAVATGDTNARAAARDADLKGLQGAPRFAAALEQMNLRAKAGAPAGFIRRWTPMVSEGTYIVMLPPDYETSGKKYPIVVILHGLGSSEERHGRMADTVGREGVIYIAVRAPFPWYQGVLPAGVHGWNAYPPDAISQMDPAWKQIPKDYVEWVFACVHDAQKHYRAEPGKVFIFGHSQGAECALNCALEHPEEVSGVFSESGFLAPGGLDTPENLAKLAKSGVPVHLIHGRDDTNVSPENSKEILAEFEKAGIKTTLEMMAGGHAMSLESCKLVKAWLDADVRGK